VKKSRILEISGYPPPRSGWNVRVLFLKKYLEAQGHECVVLNIGANRMVPSDEYETVMGAVDYMRKVWRFARRGYTPHVHVNGASPKGLALALVAELISAVARRPCVLTFHGGAQQEYFPRAKYPRLGPAFRLLFRLPRWIICNSEEVKTKIRQYGVTVDKIVPIPAFSPQYLEQVTGSLGPEVRAFYERFAHVIFCYMKMRLLFFPIQTLDAFGALAARRGDVGLVLCGIVGHMEDGVWPAVQARLVLPDLRERVLGLDDLPHESFLQALRRSSICLRTPLTDGVSSSVLEALSLGVPVVASENHSRPPGVITYDPHQPAALASLLDDVLSRREAIASALPRPLVRDTLADEASLLTM
jgi:glycosyltransferase involved in cell wall biosynthesis